MENTKNPFYKKFINAEEELDEEAAEKGVNEMLLEKVERLKQIYRRIKCLEERRK